MRDPKEILADHVLLTLKNRKVIGLGTGKTVRKLIETMAKNDLLKDKLIITSSIDTDLQLSRANSVVLSVFSGIVPEIYVDSFDFLVESEGKRVLIKGGGAALLREKLLSFFSKERLFIGEETKILSKSEVSVPVEVVPASFSFILSKLRQMGLDPIPRETNGKIGPIVTDNGNLIFDVQLRTEELCKWERNIKQLPGVVESGIFCENLYDTIVIASGEGRIQVFQRG
ncbi:ribose 5-phosphate isomerase A [Metallosphaera hakonensis]|uniref:Ribose 5-phosphate isomerase A n=1 Tax=Metallosphaera hakonensis JCM 8857 = DSM 7519 TaxID=1293036 RepID=A0A2U9ITW9_9CREN|nr:ribose 5-phosphate isomerase A [Metallosphaera hakonensis]AWR99464.1 ribose 5-phosphate isomerase A [Metallosphaera hakonensis JCM 8857 = DSM 7519]